jgi:hypothetical protein
MKTDSDIAVKNLMDFMVGQTESRFKVKQEGDDSGSYLCVYVERDEQGNRTCDTVPDKFEGWRVVSVTTPHEFIKYVMESRKE